MMKSLKIVCVHRTLISSCAALQHRKSSFLCTSVYNKLLLPWSPRLGRIHQIHSSTVNYFQPKYSLDRTVSMLLRTWTKIFEENEIPEPDLSSLHIMSHVLGIPHSQLLLNASRKLDISELATLAGLCRCRLRRMPVQYIIGEWEFRDLTLKILPPVFIPRPETEELVESVISHLKQEGKQNARILEIGCGSGAIALSLLKALPSASCVAVDKSDNACSLTLENAHTHNLQGRLQVVKKQLTDYGIANWDVTKKFDVLVSNPPYIPHCTMNMLQPEITWYEDWLALDGGKDGLEVIKKLLHFAPSILTRTGYVFLEVHHDHVEAIHNYVLSKELCLTCEETFKDFAGKERFVKLCVNNM